MTAPIHWLRSTPNRTFILYPVVVILFQAAMYWPPNINLRATVLLLWGYEQYRMVGRYRRRLGGGGPGTEVPPNRLVTTGPYRYTRNPMYLGHLIFLAGLALTFRSWLGAALLVVNIAWFQRRVLRDEVRLKSLFGRDYTAYSRRVARWIPWLA